MTQIGQGSGDSILAPTGILPGQLHHQLLDCQVDSRAFNRLVGAAAALLQCEINACRRLLDNDSKSKSTSHIVERIIRRLQSQHRQKIVDVEEPEARSLQTCP